MSSHLNAYLQDDDEYRAITRQSIIRGLAGVITYTPTAISVRLGQPGSPRVARALELMLDEINAAPPTMADDTPGPSPTTSCQPARFNYPPHSTAGVLGPPPIVVSWRQDCDLLRGERSTPSGGSAQGGLGDREPRPGNLTRRLIDEASHGEGYTSASS